MKKRLYLVNRLTVFLRIPLHPDLDHHFHEDAFPCWPLRVVVLSVASCEFWIPSFSQPIFSGYLIESIARFLSLPPQVKQ